MLWVFNWRYKVLVRFNYEGFIHFLISVDTNIKYFANMYIKVFIAEITPVHIYIIIFPCLLTCSVVLVSDFSLLCNSSSALSFPGAKSRELSLPWNFRSVEHSQRVKKRRS